MKIYRGKGIVPGIVIAPLHILGGTNNGIARRGGAASKDEEAARYRGAAETAAAEFARLSRLTRERAGEEEAHIFDIYCVMLEDEDLGGEILRRIDEGESAEDAVRASGDALASMLRESDSEYMRERSYDVDTVCDALLSALGGGSGSFDVTEPSVICARDLSPSETVSLDREKTLGFVTAEGGTSSHTAILARAMDIPAVVALGEMPDAGDGGICILDGGDGTLTVAPDDETISKYREKQRDYRNRMEQTNKVKHKKIKIGGKNIEVFANISDSGECGAAISHGADGIGLYRSEFLYMKYGREPSEDEQFEAYRNAAEAMHGAEVIIRTLDAGADKEIPYLGIAHEPNPALGLRAIRLCLGQRELFSRQIRAILRASAFGNISLMLPMITTIDELRAARELVADECAALESEGMAYDRAIKIGIMIETPAAAVCADTLACMADFISVGTNDLVQYTMACDRQNGAVSYLCEGLTEAVRRLIVYVGECAEAAGIRAGICGEAASDTSLTEFFVSAGYTELSASAPAIPRIKARLDAISSTTYLELSDNTLS